ncbi:uncharacterized protein LOC124698511 isoform X1 [Lolium rigidum]|uniref:uncharacterized protein LOC124698511 isoform X1 n=1 Tax=Lolium rigidum TaxID=89674 RepID=UPI001F5CD909|nr:uncharacterized protein LOC124698511 isoform X1 [Lolium rigidum]
MQQWLLNWISNASDFHSMILAVAVWHIWENRNSIRNGEKMPHPSRVTKRMGIGVVIRNHLGLMLAESRRYVDHVDNPELGEAIAMRHALMFAEENGFQKIIVASDCFNLITKVRSHENDRSHIGALVFDIKSRAPKFTSCCFTHVSRYCNEAPHVLAKSAEYDAGSCWFNEIPDVIRTTVCTEQASMYE